MDRILADLEALNVEIRELHEQLTETRATRDLHERLAASAVDTAEQVADETRRRFRQIVTVVLAGLLIWTPFVAWGAILWHQQFLDDCVNRPSFERLADTPWHCALFPGGHQHKE